MDVQFDDGPDGLLEAESLFRILHRMPSTPQAEALAAELERHALGRLGGEADRVRGSMHDASIVQRLRSLKHRYLGPSNQELELSRQRSEALERADRAEKSAFEALADMAEMTRERDAALAELERLRHDRAH